MIYLIKTSNAMTTHLYYCIIKNAFEISLSQNVIITDSLNNNVNKKKDLVIVGSSTVAFKLLLKGFKKVIVWYQGVEPEESAYINRSKLIVKVKSFIERFTLRYASFCIFVSKEMQRHYENKYSLQFDTHSTYIMPCFNEIKLHEDAFDKKDISMSFVYCGGLGPWQCLEETIDLYKQLALILKRKTSFRIYTNDVDGVNIILAKKGMHEIICKYLPKEELEKEISSAHFGFVLRKDDIVNNVATPTKFSTYLSYGIIPIFSDSICDFKENTNFMMNRICLHSFDIQENCKKILDFINNIYDPNNLKQEYQAVFNSYYSESLHTKLLAEKIANKFGLGLYEN